MRKILLVITKSNWGGAQRYVYDLATNLPTHEWSVGVVLGGSGGKGAPGGRLQEELKRCDIRTLFIPAFMRDMSLVAEWRALRQLWDLFAIESPDVVHLNSSKAGGLGACAARAAGVPHIVFTVHGLPWEEDRSLLVRLFIRFASWCTFVLCHRVIALSRGAAERIARMPLCKRKVVYIPNGIAPLSFLPREEAQAALLEGRRAPVIIGAVGELTWNKGYHTLLRAASALKRQGKEFLLCIVGDGEERTFMRTMIEEEGLSDMVHLAGFVPEASRYLKAFDVFVLPSLKEGLPYVLLEAGQAELPVVASRTGGVPDVVLEGVSGLLVPPKDHHALAHALGALIADAPKRASLAEGLMLHIQKEFSLEQMLKKTVRAYS